MGQLSENEICESSRGIGEYERQEKAGKRKYILFLSIILFILNYTVLIILLFSSIEGIDHQNDQRWQTCMLLYLLNVLKQRGHANCVGPIRIWAEVGIQYCPLLILSDSSPEASLIFSSLSETSAEYRLEAESADALVLGSPKCKATVTASSSSKHLDVLRSSFFLSTSMALNEDWRYCASSSWCLRWRKGRASVWGGEDWNWVEDMTVV